MSARTLEGDLRAAAAGRPDHRALVAPDREVSYAGLDRAADRIAGGLRQLGVRPGDRVAIVLPNAAAAAEAIYGVWRAGAAIVPLNPTVKEGKLAALLAHVGAAAALCDSERAATVRAGAAGVEGLRAVSDPDDLDGGPGGPSPGALDVDLAAVVYTSGSTGEPRGVMSTHRSTVFACDSIVEYLEMGPEDRVLSVLPLSFGYGLYQLLTCVRARATLVLEAGIAFPGRLVARLEDEAITGLPGVPTVWAMLTSLRGLAERELPHLRYLTNAGAALSATGVAEVRRTFPRARLYSMYGQTECVRACYLPPAELDARPTSVGVAIPGTELWIEDESGRPVANGETGELVVRGSHVMAGYWRDPEATAERLRPGPGPGERVLATGDLFRRDAEGYLYFVARRDDVIKSRGEKVAPREVEEALHAFPGVREAAVVGAPDRLLGQAVHAHVAFSPDLEAAPAELRRHCAARLEAHMVPGRVLVHPSLPRTPNGKIDRRALMAAGGE